MLARLAKPFGAIPIGLATLLLLSGPCLGADPAASPAVSGAAAIIVVDASGSEKTVTNDLLAQLPSVPVTGSFETEHARQASFEGPLLWAVLSRVGAVDGAAPRDQVRQTVLISGQDGYTAVLALGEIAPALEGKQVIVALRMNGQPIEPGHLRIVIPGDRHGGRSVHELTRIEIGSPPHAIH